MKLYVISIFRHIEADAKSESKGETKGEAASGTTAIRLATAMHLDSISYFTRRATGEHMQFAARLAATKTTAGSRASMTAKDSGYVCHVHVLAKGLAAAVVADTEYPQRVAFQFVQYVRVRSSLCPGALSLICGPLLLSARCFVADR